jgi:hypothetical protein
MMDFISSFLIGTFYTSIKDGMYYGMVSYICLTGPYKQDKDQIIYINLNILLLGALDQNDERKKPCVFKGQKSRS